MYHDWLSSTRWTGESFVEMRGVQRSKAAELERTHFELSGSFEASFA